MTFNKILVILATMALPFDLTYGLRMSPYGLYEDIIVEISDQVPRQKCQRALDNLEVSR